MKDESKLKLIASHIITSKNPQAKRKLVKHGIRGEELVTLEKIRLAALGFNAKEINDIKSNWRQLAQGEVEKARSKDIEFIFKEEQYYPPMLAEIYDPPDFIYVMGDKELLKGEKIAVVGSRQASSYGWFCLRQILPDLCRAGLVIVSGMAYGIDSMAHKVALKEQGKTIGVNAGGLLHLYPAGNQGLIKRIEESGCIISEFPMDTVPRPHLFPIRNRIIAGISKAVLVAEAAMRSGSLITARLALEQDRDIFAVPGRIDSPISRGTNYLIQQGAKLITCADDILEEYGIRLESQRKDERLLLSKKEQKILDLMPVNELKGVDYFVDNLDFSVSEVISLLMGMILKNIVVEEAGGYKRIR